MPKHPSIDDLKTQASDDVRRLNPSLFGLGKLDADQHSKPTRTLVKKAPSKRRGRTRSSSGSEIVITIVAYLHRRMDDDNLAHACKPLRDAIAQELGVDDGDMRLRWEYGQTETRGPTGVSVKVQKL